MVNYEEMLVKNDVESILERVREVCSQKLVIKGFNSYTMENEDVIQEVLLQVYRRIKEYDCKRSKFSTFVETIINNKLTDCFRASSNPCNVMIAKSKCLTTAGWLDDDDKDSVYVSVDGEYGYGELLIEVEKRLAGVEKQTFDLLVAGYRQREIATILQRTPARVSQIVKSVQNKIKKLI
jgi:RNA polymerase sporulation-specific sigma factor